MTVREMAMKWLKDNEMDGLAADVCGCRLNDLIPCALADIGNCYAAKLKDCNKCEYLHDHLCEFDYAFCMEEAP